MSFRQLGLGMTAVMLTTVTLMSASQAAILKTDDFSYSDGTLTAVSSSNWTNLSGTGTFLQVSGGVVTPIVHGSGSREDVTTVFSLANIVTGNLFASFKFNVATAPTAGNDYFFALHDIGGSSFRGRTYLAAPAVAAPGEFRLGFDNDGAASLFTTNLTAGTDYYAIVGIDAATNQSKLWVGTSLNSLVESMPTLDDTTSVGTLVGLARAVIRQGSSITVANSMSFDDLVIGTTFASVVPEPNAIAFSTIAGLAFVGYRLRRKQC